MAAYVDTVIREWGMRRDEVPAPHTSIYLGGGTPSLLPTAHLDRLFAAIPLDAATEITMEANPEQITPELMKWLADSPVNRLSVGIQSLDDAQLAIIGRRHTARQALEAVERIQRSSITNYSLDLIYGLPGQDLDSWKSSLGQLLEARPPHLSCYMLTYEPRTRLDAMRIAGKVAPASDDDLISMYDHLCSAAAQAGYEHYEISNFAQPGCRAVHNTNYWLDRPYIGLGAAAHSFDGRVRRVNPADLRRYMALTDAPVYEIEEEDPDSLHNDLLLTRLRLTEGLSLSFYAERYGFGAAQRLERIAAPYIASEQMELTPDRCLRITERGWLVTDSILVDLFR